MVAGLRKAIRRLNPAISEEARDGVFNPLIYLSN